MTLENGQKQSIMDYFKKEYNYRIKNPDWPLIHCGDPKRTIYLPIELLDLERQVSFIYLEILRLAGAVLPWEFFLVKKLEIEKTKTTFIISVLKVVY